jgi:enoyl-CoA hydratase
MVNAEIFDPEGAAAAGYLDRVVPADEVADEASRVATDLAGLDGPALAATKARLREDVLRSLRGAIEADDAEMRALFS